MRGKPVEILPLADADLRQATRWYREQGGDQLAVRWVSAVEAALRLLSEHPRAGSTRFAVSLRLGGLRCWPITDFPYLLFYVEREARLDVWRVLHAQRDVPEWLGAGSP